MQTEIRENTAGLVRAYLGEGDPKNRLASPLYGDLAGLPPIRVHAGDDPHVRTRNRATGAPCPTSVMSVP
jgi:acetyl esterase/lipase